jgi:hypothetical protein
MNIKKSLYDFKRLCKAHLPRALQACPAAALFHAMNYFSLLPLSVC